MWSTNLHVKICRWGEKEKEPGWETGKELISRYLNLPVMNLEMSHTEAITIIEFSREVKLPEISSKSKSGNRKLIHDLI